MVPSVRSILRAINVVWGISLAAIGGWAAARWLWLDYPTRELETAATALVVSGLLCAVYFKLVGELP